MTDETSKTHNGDPQTLSRLFEGQFIHLLALCALIGATAAVAQLPQMTQGELWGLTATTWLWIALGSAVAHQVYVWAVWRAELHYEAVTRLLGAKGFRIFQLIFAVLGLSRFSIVALAVANRDQLAIPAFLRWPMAVLFIVLAGYLFYSVIRYFGFDRAAGLDHFDTDIRDAPLVDQGIFRFTSNGMYIYGFLILWVPGLILQSPAALVAAGFQHLYIWVHYFCTEKPDMEFIYGDD